MSIEDGTKTQLQKGQAGAEARLDLLEQRLDDVGELAQRIAALEALAGVADEPPKFMNSTNGRLLIAAVLIAFLAFIGWEASDIISLTP